MDQATQTMIANLEKNTGKSLADWIKIVQDAKLARHGEVLKLLKGTHGLTHGYANLVAHKAKQSDAGSAADTNDLVEAQYSGKEHFRPIYDALVEQVKQFGSDVELAPKKAYVSLRRKKQFAILQPATKTRYEVQLNLKGHDAQGRLEAINKASAMCSHVIKLSDAAEADAEVVKWLRTAYDNAG